MLRPPRKFGKYLLLERVAVGGMAEVFVAKAFGVEGFQRLLAIKKILPTLGEDRDFIRMFVDEARIAAQLTHPTSSRCWSWESTTAASTSPWSTSPAAICAR